MNTNAILPSIQVGFRSGHTTTTALFKVGNDIASAICSSKCAVLILLDQSKAFDLVNFELLLAKLNYIGFGKAVLRWF